MCNLIYRDYLQRNQCHAASNDGISTAPWQKGANENTNKLLRQYMPKKIDLSVYSQEQLDMMAEELNNRPRKTLNFLSPSQKISAVLQ